VHRLMPSHRGYAGDQLPPLPLLERLIDQASSPHWYWAGDFADDGAGLRYAAYAWAPPGEATVVYCVARVLWAYAKRQSLFRQRLRNLCDLTTCVNPAHFERSQSRGDAVGPVTLPTDLATADGTGARLVYLNGAPTVHILRDDTAYAACYAAALRHVVTAPAGTVITCARCVTAWRGFDRPLQAVLPVGVP